MSFVTVINEGVGIVEISFGGSTDGDLLDYPAICELLDAIEVAGHDPAVRVVALMGGSVDFCIGTRDSAMGEWPTRFQDRLHRGSIAEAPIPQQELLKVLWRLPRPTVAVVRGRAFGFGLDLACACDVRLVQRDALFGDPRLAAGALPSTGITYLLPRLIGLSQAMRLLLLGDIIDGDEAERIGLVYRSIGREKMGDSSRELLESIASMATRSYSLIKRQILEQLDLDHETALLHSLAIRQTHVIHDQEEGMRAFREKRAPSFSGR